MRAHLALHLETMGGPVEADELRECGPVRIPRPRPPSPVEVAAPARG